MLVIDADAHIEEGNEAWSYMDPAYFHRRPIAVALGEDTAWGEHNAVWLIDYKVRQSAANPTSMVRAQAKLMSIESQELTSVPARLADLDQFGIEKQVIYPSIWLGCLAEDVDLEIQLVRSYNTFMATQCNQSDGRLFYSAVLPYRNPSAAVAEVSRVKEMGSAVSFFIRGMEWDLPISHPMLFPVYEEAQSVDLVMALHIGFGSPSMSRIFEGMPRTPSARLPFVHPLGQGLISGQLSQYALSCLLGSTMLGDFPRLRWVVLETGSEWIPPLVRSISRRKGRDLSKYFREGQIYCSVEPDEDIAHVADCIGDECMVVASDMPHEDDFHHDRPEAAWLERGDLSGARLQRLLRDNTLALYKI